MTTESTTSIADGKGNVPPGSASLVSTWSNQIPLLLWKRYCEVVVNQPWEWLRVLFPPTVFLILIHLAYATFSFFYPGGVEPFLIPFAFFQYNQRVSLFLSQEESSGVRDQMTMMGLLPSSYWISVFLSEGVITGGIIAFLCAVIAGGELFNQGSFGDVLGLLLMYCLASVPFCSFLVSFVETPPTAGQVTLGMLIGSFVLYVVVFLVKEYTIDLESAQILSCLLPPVALQLGCQSFLRSYQGISLRSICGMMVADTALYSVLTWYFSHVWPSKHRVQKTWYFIFQPSYWQGQLKRRDSESIHPDDDTTAGIEAGSNMEKANEQVLGRPTVIVNHLMKTFGSTRVVNDLSFKLYENQIFSLLGHNGAGKTTTINILTGLVSADSNATTTVQIYPTAGSSSLGVCPQKDVLFDNLTIREHLIFFSRLKGFTEAAARAEAETLASVFHLEHRLSHKSEELSGGQKRKLSVSIAICGGSKFIVLDEPTAGMDPLARRELWDLLSGLRQGRTMLLTTHYMDEADALGDRVGIMSAGKMMCLGSTQFLKMKFGSGYKLIVEKTWQAPVDSSNLSDDGVSKMVQSVVPSAQLVVEESIENHLVFLLSYSSSSVFGKLFDRLDSDRTSLNIKNYGINCSTLEDVFLRVAEDESNSATPTTSLNDEAFTQRYEMSINSQILGIMKRKLLYALNDWATIPLLLLPVVAGFAGTIIYKMELVSKFSVVNAVIANAIYTVGYLGTPGILAEFVVRERQDRLKNVLMVMGCDYRAYWIGTWFADMTLLLVPSLAIIFSWIIFGTDNYLDGNGGEGGLNILVLLFFNAQISAFAYLLSFIFTSPKSCIASMPVLLIILAITPSFIFSLYNTMKEFLTSSSGAPSSIVASVIWWSTVFVSPQGGFYGGLLAAGEDIGQLDFASFPPVGVSIVVIVGEAILFMYYTLQIEKQSVAVLEPVHSDRIVDESQLDPDVIQERHKVLLSAKHDSLQSEEKKTTEDRTVPVRIDRLRKVYSSADTPVIAVEDMCFELHSGEIFGLLGANGAGKTTILSMLTRLSTPTSGDAFIAGHSVLSEFNKVATRLGVVTQVNSLWDRLTVENHLSLFARLRGVPENNINHLVDSCLEALELKIHRKKKAMELSGGMKRKLCVAIALIGDPEVVLLDEPSAGLDPVSRRNLWNVILRTMQHRAVILTTHSMEEAEVLCQRIGIMVQGQLRALGSKQHLKSKFGSGFQLTMKLSSMPTKPAADAAKSPMHNASVSTHIDQIKTFLCQYCPTTSLVYENGGFVTFQVNEVKMGALLTALEHHRQDIGIDEYSIAQPTLEQVFIKIVNQVEGTTVSSKKDDFHRKSNSWCCFSCSMPVPGKSRATCGCSDLILKVAAGVLFTLFVIGLILGIALRIQSPDAAPIALAFGIFFLIVGIVFVSLLCCSCCRVSLEEV